METMFQSWLIWILVLSGSSLVFILTRWIYPLWKIMRFKSRLRHYYMYGGQFSPVTIHIETDQPIKNGSIRIYWYNEKLADLSCDNLKVGSYEDDPSQR